MSTVIAAAVTHVGNVRDHNEDSHLIDPDRSIFAVADGMGGHAAGEVASAIAVRVTQSSWTSDTMTRLRSRFAEVGDAESRRGLMRAVRQGVIDAHLQIVEAAKADERKSGMGTTLTGFLVAGGDAIFAHAGDSRAYLVRDGVTIQLSEDHTLLARLKAAGVDVAAEEGETSRYEGVLTNALGIGDATQVATFLISLCSGDRIVLCSDGIHDYFEENSLGELVRDSASPALAAQALVDGALERGGADNATVVVVKVVEAGESRIPPEQRKREQEAVAQCPLVKGLTVPERLRALRIMTPRELRAGDRLAPIALGEPVAYIVLTGQVDVPHEPPQGPGGVIYVEALIDGTRHRERELVAKVTVDARLLMIRQDDFFELTEEDAELGVKLYAEVAKLVARS